jgi:transcriptional regulator of acetoin/glycerol metabolism
MTSVDLESPGDNPSRPEIQLSWKRSILNGIQTEPRLEDLPVIDLDPSSRLMSAAQPVLEQMAAKLAGTNYSLLLADRNCRLMYRWFDEPRFESVMELLGLRIGASIGEETVGTNALGTAVETRRGIVVHGKEHFIEPFKGFSCYGHPILNPVSRRLEGVLDITGVAADANPLLAPFLVRAVEDIELRLLDQAKASERAILAAFQAASQHRRPVAAFGEDLVLTNKAALDLLEPPDYAVLRMLMEDLDRTPARRAQVDLVSGATVDVHVQRIIGAGEGTLFHFEQAAAPRHGQSRRTSVEEVVDSGPLLVHGAQGTGRSTEARRVAPDAELLNCADVAVEGEGIWARRLKETLSQSRTVCLENIELLPEALVPVVVECLTRGGGPRLVLTSAPVDQLTGAQLGLAGMVTHRVELKPLRNRAGELADIATRLLRELNPVVNVRLIPSVIEALASRPWPGNLHELRAVMAHVAQHRTVGDVTLNDLPEDYRSTSPARQLPGRERAERDAIVEALRANQGNKVKAARELGISRTTLYARMRALRVTGL